MRLEKSFNIKSLLFRIERSRLRWFGHASRKPQERLPKQTLYAKVNEKRPSGRLQTRWLDSIKNLGWNRLGLCSSKMQSVLVNQELYWHNLKLLPLQLSRKSSRRKRKEIYPNTHYV